MARTRDMTKGNIFLHIILYALPMIFGNFLQLSYNMADSVIIGKLLGKNPLAACSASTPASPTRCAGT